MRPYNRKRFFVPVALMAALAAQGPGAKAEENSLTVYMSDEQLERYQPAIDTFQEQYPGVEVNLEIYHMQDGFLQEASILATRLMAGEGPDLILSENSPIGDLQKLLKAQVFAPLNEFMAEDGDWNDENYIMPVIDGGKFGETQYVIPLTYWPILMVSSREALEEAHLTEEDCPDTLSLMKGIAALYDTDYSSRIVANGVDVGIGEFPLYLDGDYLDYESGEILTDPQILKEACESYARMYQEDGGMDILDYEAYGEAVLLRDAYCIPLSISTIYSVLSSASVIAAQETPAILPLRNRQGEGLANVAVYGGIRANSGHKQDAWNMLRLLLSREMQEAEGGSRGYFPVNRAALDGMLDQGLAWIGDPKYHSLPFKELSGDFVESLRQAASTPRKCIYISNIVCSSFREKMEPFFLGEDSYENCMKDFEGFARIYLTE